jgi:hypothetical protein
METETMLTTFDNPFDPFDEFDPWLMYDIELGWNTCGLLARVARHSDEFSTIEDKLETERAIDAIVNDEFLGCIFTKVTRSTANGEEKQEKENENEAETAENEASTQATEV